jgi:hypothetical protein
LGLTFKSLGLNCIASHTPWKGIWTK